MKAFVTGICGFAGRHLTSRLLALGCEVHGFQQEGVPCEVSDSVQQQVTWWTGDIRDFASLAGPLSSVQPDFIFHLAATMAGSLAEVLAVNLTGTQNLLEAARTAGGRPCRVLLVGSSAEYGRVSPHELPITEDTPFRPVSAYGVSKVAADVLGHFYWARYGLDVVRARPFNYIGPGQGLGFVCSDLAYQVALAERAQSPPALRVGNLEARRDWVDVRDAVQAFILALQRAPGGAVYNVCSGRAYSVQELVQQLLALTDCPLRVVQDAGRIQPADVPVQIGDFGRLAADVGWQPTIPWQQSIRDVLDYWRDRVSRTERSKTE